MDIADKNIPISQNVLEYEDKRDKMLLEPLWHFIQTVPTDIWEEFIIAFNSWLNVPDEILKEVAKNFRYFYYSDRLLEAIRDNLPPSMSNQLFCISTYGEACTLNALFLIRVIASRNLTKVNLSKAPTLYIEQMEESCIARYMELQWNETVICPTEAEYYHMIVKQTFGNFGAQLKFLHLYSTNKNNFNKLSAIFGLFLRILEDYQYFVSTEGSNCKLYLPNETLGSFKLPIIHAVRSETIDGKKILEILRRRTDIKELKIHVVSLLERIGSLKYTRRTLMKLKEEALQEMRTFEKNPLLESIFNKYFNIPAPSDTIATETSMDSTNDSIETLKVSSYLNQMENVQSDEKVKKELLEPFNHLDAVPKKNYVMSIFNYLNDSIKTPEDNFATLKSFLGIYGYSILMLDDIQDKSSLRKSVPCSYLIYGMINTINSIIYTISSSFETLVMLNNPKLLNIYYEFTLEMYRGQGMELHWRDNYICPTEEEYVQMIGGKTGAPVGVVLHMMKVCSTSTINIDKIPLAMAMYFQVYDDYANLLSKEYQAEKGFCEDISEGKFGFPTIHAVTTHPEEGKQLIDILRQRTQDVEVKKSYLSLLKKCGSFEYTRKKLNEYRKQLYDSFEPFYRRDDIMSYMAKRFPELLESKDTEPTFFH